MRKLLTAASTTAMLFALASPTFAQDTAETVQDTAAEVVDGAVEAATDAVEGAEATAEAVVADEAAATEAVEAPVDVDLNQVVAKGDGFEIYVGDVLALLKELPAQYKQEDPAKLMPELVDQLVSQEILTKEADLESDEAKFQLRQARRAIAVNNVLDSYIEAKLTDDYLAETYATVIGEMPEEEEFNASHILVETQEEAEAIIADLNGGADFAEVAKEKSTGPSGPEGGELGWFGKGQMVPEFETAVIGLESGEISKEPVQTQFGFHVIKVNEKRIKPKPTQEEVGQQLNQYATQVLMDEKVQSAREGAEVEIIEGINPAILKADF